MTYKPYAGKRVYRRKLVDIFSDPYTAIVGLIVLVWIMAIGMWIMAGQIAKLSNQQSETVVIPGIVHVSPTLPVKADIQEPITEICPEEEIKNLIQDPELVTLTVVEEPIDIEPGCDPETEYILKVITAEAGTDPVLCGCVTQALFNTCEKYNWQYTPAEMMRKYRYCDPLSWYSEEAAKAFDDVFYSGVTWDCVGDATIFYAPKYCSGTPFHESQIFVAEINGVRFFEERG